MSYYRLYFMNPRDGHILRFAEFSAPDDAAAFVLAREHEGENPLELWSGARKVSRIEAYASSMTQRPNVRNELGEAAE